MFQYKYGGYVIETVHSHTEKQQLVSLAGFVWVPLLLLFFFVMYTQFLS